MWEEERRDKRVCGGTKKERERRERERTRASERTSFSARKQAEVDKKRE